MSKVIEEIDIDAILNKEELANKDTAVRREENPRSKRSKPTPTASTDALDHLINESSLKEEIIDAGVDLDALADETMKVEEAVGQPEVLTKCAWDWCNQYLADPENICCSLEHEIDFLLYCVNHTDDPEYTKEKCLADPSHLKWEKDFALLLLQHPTLTLDIYADWRKHVEDCAKDGGSTPQSLPEFLSLISSETLEEVNESKKTTQGTTETLNLSSTTVTKPTMATTKTKSSSTTKEAASKGTIPKKDPGNDVSEQTVPNTGSADTSWLEMPNSSNLTTPSQPNQDQTPPSSTHTQSNDTTTTQPNSNPITTITNSPGAGASARPSSTTPTSDSKASPVKDQETQQSQTPGPAEAPADRDPGIRPKQRLADLLTQNKTGPRTKSEPDSAETEASDEPDILVSLAAEEAARIPHPTEAQIQAAIEKGIQARQALLKQKPLNPIQKKQESNPTPTLQTGAPPLNNNPQPDSEADSAETEEQQHPIQTTIKTGDRFVCKKRIKGAFATNNIYEVTKTNGIIVLNHKEHAPFLSTRLDQFYEHFRLYSPESPDATRIRNKTQSQRLAEQKQEQTSVPPAQNQTWLEKVDAIEEQLGKERPPLFSGSYEDHVAELNKKTEEQESNPSSQLETGEHLPTPFADLGLNSEEQAQLETYLGDDRELDQAAVKELGYKQQLAWQKEAQINKEPYSAVLRRAYQAEWDELASHVLSTEDTPESKSWQSLREYLNDSWQTRGLSLPAGTDRLRRAPDPNKPLVGSYYNEARIPSPIPEAPEEEISVAAPSPSVPFQVLCHTACLGPVEEETPDAPAPIPLYQFQKGNLYKAARDDSSATIRVYEPQSNVTVEIPSKDLKYWFKVPPNPQLQEQEHIDLSDETPPPTLTTHVIPAPKKSRVKNTASTSDGETPEIKQQAQSLFETELLRSSTRPQPGLGEDLILAADPLDSMPTPYIKLYNTACFLVEAQANLGLIALWLDKHEAVLREAVHGEHTVQSLRAFTDAMTAQEKAHLQSLLETPASEEMGRLGEQYLLDAGLTDPVQRALCYTAARDLLTKRLPRLISRKASQFPYDYLCDQLEALSAKEPLWAGEKLP